MPSCRHIQAQREHTHAFHHSNTLMSPALYFFYFSIWKLPDMMRPVLAMTAHSHFSCRKRCSSHTVQVCSSIFTSQPPFILYTTTVPLSDLQYSTSLRYNPLYWSVERCEHQDSICATESDFAVVFLALFSHCTFPPHLFSPKRDFWPNGDKERDLLRASKHAHELYQRPRLSLRSVRYGIHELSALLLHSISIIWKAHLACFHNRLGLWCLDLQETNGSHSRDVWS